MVAAMTGGTLAWGITALAAALIGGLLAGMWIGYERGYDQGAEDAEQEMRDDARWKGLADTPARPAPAPAPPPAPRTGPGKHRHPAGPRHAALPVAGYLPAEPRRWAGTITVPAPVQQPPWDTRPPEPQTEVLEPTAVLSPPVPDTRTDSAWTRDMARDMDAWIREHIGATDATLKEITR
jgi:hypothetical protein